MINLYLMRHGQASFDAPTDALRPLTPVGEREVETVSDLLKIHADTILVSPYLRAQMTLQIFNRTRHCNVEKCSLVIPEAEVGVLVDHLTMREELSLMLIAHNPLLSHLANLLTFEDRFALNTASVVHLQGEIIAAGCMTLVKQYDPKLLD